MFDTERSSKLLQHVLVVIKNKGWYGYNPETGGFDWQISLNKIASELRLPIDAVTNAFETAFTPECLMKVKVQDSSDPNTSEEIPMIQAFSNLGLQMHIWTVGDPAWQQTKYEKSGAIEYIQQENFHCYTSNKHSELPTLVTQIGGDRQEIFIIVDDKKSNEELAREATGALNGNNTNILTFHLNSTHPDGNAQAFYEFVKSHSDKNPVLILDFDGVVADTDGVLFGKAAENITSLFQG